VTVWRALKAMLTFSSNELKPARKVMNILKRKDNTKEKIPENV